MLCAVLNKVVTDRAAHLVFVDAHALMQSVPKARSTSAARSSRLT